MASKRHTRLPRRERRLALVVDDDPDARELACYTLVVQGFDVVEASNGRDALELLLVADRLPQIILLDLHMPVMTGWEFLVARRTHPHIASIPVLITSGSGERLRSEVCALDAVVDYLPKPLDLEQLRGKLAANTRSSRPSMH
jgi:CheY-like chemotaxis protein